MEPSNNKQIMGVGSLYFHAGWKVLRVSDMKPRFINKRCSVLFTLLLYGAFLVNALLRLGLPWCK